MKIMFFIPVLIMSFLELHSSDFNPPKAEMIPVVEKIHGYTFTDYYRWLEDKNNPQTIEWSRAQHNYTVNYLKSHTGEIPGLRDEIAAALDRDLKGAPFFKANREFFFSKKKGEPQSKLYTIIEGKEKLIFDPVEFDPSGNSAISGSAFTKDGNKAAIGIQYKGNEISTYRIIDTRTGNVIGEPITDLSSFGWTYDENHAYITQRSKEMIENQEPLRTYLHKIGDKRSNDKFLIAPSDAKNFASYWDTECGTFTFVSEGDFWTNSLRVKKPGTNDELKLIYPRSDFKASPYVRDEKMYIFTNHDAKNYKIMVTTVDKPEFENWTDLIPEQETVIKGFAVTSDYLIVQDRKDVISRLTAYNHEGKNPKAIELPEIGNVSSLSYHKESNSVYVNISTFTSSTKLYKLDGKSLKWEFIYQDKSPINTDNITSRQVFFKSKDGTKVPMFIIHRKDMQLNGNNPTLIYGYGGFNHSLEPSFIGSNASFINRGGVYVIVNLRGGSEYGEAWHQDGMLFRKQNTFDDFISAAEHLIKENYTNPEKIACRGGSNGGLLIGAVVTQRPDLFKAAVCAVPLLDMVRYHKFLIARYWIPEYGDPDKYEDFMNILKYSPQHNIRQGYSYPAMLVKAGENDARVDPLHAKKFAAALQNNQGQTNPIMLYVDFDSGHGSGKSTAHQIDDSELEWRFIMSSLGMSK